MIEPSSMNAYILAGGKSTRMRTDKALLRLGGKTFLERAIECTLQLFRGVYVVGRDHVDPRVKGSFPDMIEGIGPLGGIYTALRRTDQEYNFFIGVDYPFARSYAIASLAGFLDQRYGGLIPITPDGPHPLFAFYSKRCISAIERCVDEERYEIRCIARSIPILFLDLLMTMGRDAFEGVKESFLNINSERDYRDVKRLTREAEKGEKIEKKI
jgi:molybdopterin-guanine dinucleotide biosynthesis protein A